MAYDGNGVFNRLYNWEADAAAGINILAERMDAEMNGFATGLSMVLTRDGQAGMLAPLDMGGFKITGLGNAVADNDAVSKIFADDRFVKRAGDTMPGSLIVDGGTVAIRSAGGSNIHLWLRDKDTDVNFALLYYDRSNDVVSLRRYKDGSIITQMELGDKITLNRDLSMSTSGRKIEWSGGDTIQWDTGVGLIGKENDSEVWRLGSDIETGQYLITLGSRVYFGGRPTSGSPDYIRWVTGTGLFGYENAAEVFRIGGAESVITGVGSVTTTSPANVWVSTGGTLRRSTSSGVFKRVLDQPINGLEIVKDLRPVLFLSLHKGDDPDEQHLGFIAEEVASTIPAARTDEGQNYDTRAIVAVLVDAVQQLLSRVEKIEQGV